MKEFNFFLWQERLQGVVWSLIFQTAWTFGKQFQKETLRDTNSHPFCEQDLSAQPGPGHRTQSMQEAGAGSSLSLAAGIPNSSVLCRVTDLFMVIFFLCCFFVVGFFSSKEASASKDQLLWQPDKQEFHLNSFHTDFSLLLREAKYLSLCPWAVFKVEQALLQAFLSLWTYMVYVRVTVTPGVEGGPWGGCCSWNHSWITASETGWPLNLLPQGRIVSVWFCVSAGLTEFLGPMT